MTGAAFWIKVPHMDAQVVTLYTTDEALATKFGMHKKSRGKFYYKKARAAPILRYLRLGTEKSTNQGLYMKMMHKCPPISALLRKNQKIPQELKDQMEAFFEWDTVTKTFNTEKVWSENQ